MNFHTQIKWSVFLIAVYWLPEIVELKSLPRDNFELKTAVTCLTASIKKDFRDEWFRGKLTYGEILEEFCEDEDVFNVEKKLAKYGNQKMNTEVKKCLHGFNHERVYDDYYKFGEREFVNAIAKLTLSTVLSEEENVNDIRDDSDDDDEISLNDLNEPISKTEQSEIQSSKNQEHPDSPDEDSEKEISDISKFVIGLCNQDESLNFEDLDDEEEKKDTIHCLHNCAKEFFDKIEGTLMAGRLKIKKTLKSLSITEDILKDEKIDKEKFHDEIKFFNQDTKLDDLENTFEGKFYQGEKEKIQTITNEGMEYLKRYSEAYSIETEYLISKLNKDLKSAATAQMERDTQNNENFAKNKSDDKKIIDSRLSRSFIYYKNGCAKRQCFMKKTSVPLYDYIYHEAEGKKTTTLASGSESAQQTTPILTNNESNTVKDNVTVITNEKDEYKTEFFKVLISSNDDSKE